MNRTRSSKDKENIYQIECLMCGGRREIINPDHCIADMFYEHRYITCTMCFGLGTISERRYN